MLAFWLKASGGGTPVTRVGVPLQSGVAYGGAGQVKRPPVLVPLLLELDELEELELELDELDELLVPVPLLLLDDDDDDALDDVELVDVPVEPLLELDVDELAEELALLAVFVALIWAVPEQPQTKSATQSEIRIQRVYAFSAWSLPAQFFE